MAAVNKGKKSAKGSMAATRNSFAYAAEFLKNDHHALDKLISKFEHPQSASEIDADTDLLDELSADDQIEEEIFFRAARNSKRNGDEREHYLLDENEFEDMDAGGLISDLQGTSPDDPQFDARVIELSEYINRGV